LLPYYIINYEKELSKIVADEQQMVQLTEEYSYIIARLSDVTREDDSGIFRDILKMM